MLFKVLSSNYDSVLLYWYNAYFLLLLQVQLKVWIADFGGNILLVCHKIEYVNIPHKANQ